MRSLLAVPIALLAFACLSSVAVADSIRINPAFPSTGDRLDFVVDACLPPVVQWDPPAVVDSTITLEVLTPVIDPPPGGPSCGIPTTTHFQLAALPAGTYTVEFRRNQLLMAATGFDVHAAQDAMLLRGRFRAEAFWTGRDGVEHPAAAVPLSDESGFFWFFGSDNAELTLKVLDGQPVNGHFWVFIAAMTDVAWRARITDTSIVCITTPCGEKNYAVPAGRTRNVIDLEAY